LVTNIPEVYIVTGNNYFVATDDADTIETAEFHKLLNEAMNEDLSAVEKTGCVKYGFDLNDLPIVTFLPKLGLNTANNDKDKDIGTLKI